MNINQAIHFKGLDKPTNPELAGLKKGDKAVFYKNNGENRGDAFRNYEMELVTIQSIEGHQGEAQTEWDNDKYELTKDLVDKVTYKDSNGKKQEILAGDIKYKHWPWGREDGKKPNYKKEHYPAPPRRVNGDRAGGSLVSVEHFIKEVLPTFKQEITEIIEDVLIIPQLHKHIGVGLNSQLIKLTQ